MKVALFADKFIGLEVLRYLIDNFKNDLALVVVTGDNELSQYAKNHSIPTEIFDLNINKTIKSFAIDIGILAWWPKIINPELINIPDQGFINFHPSFLPYNKGKHYNFWALVEKVPFGVTLHRVDEGIDTGDIIAQEKIAYDWTDTGESLFKKAQTVILDLFKTTYPILRDKDLSLIAKPQPKSEGSFHFSHEIDEVCKIDLSKVYNAEYLLNLLRARTFADYPACSFKDELGNEYEVRVKITRKMK
jgi:methionyl-tRNA formyltransferase